MIFRRKFCIDWQPNRRAVLVAWQLDREFDMIAVLFARLHVSRELVGREYLFKQCPKLNLAPAAACFHIGENLLQSADVARKLLHCAQPLMDLLESVAHDFE